MNILAPLFFIGSSSFLQVHVHVTRKTIKYPIGLKFGKIGPGTVELAALELL